MGYGTWLVGEDSRPRGLLRRIVAVVVRVAKVSPGLVGFTAGW